MFLATRSSLTSNILRESFRGFSSFTTKVSGPAIFLLFSFLLYSGWFFYNFNFFFQTTPAIQTQVVAQKYGLFNHQQSCQMSGGIRGKVIGIDLGTTNSCVSVMVRILYLISFDNRYRRKFWTFRYACIFYLFTGGTTS